MKYKFIISNVLLLFLMSFASADALDGFGCGTWNMMSGAYGMGFGIFGWLFSSLILIALVLLIVWLIKQIQKK